MTKKKAIIVDLDNCLFCHKEFDKYLPEENTQLAWNKYHKAVNNYENLPINNDVKEFIDTWYGLGYSLIFITAREETTDIYCNTSAALSNLYPRDDYTLWMRPEGNLQSSDALKRCIYELHVQDYYQVELCIDDNLNNLNMFAEFGLKTLHYSDKGIEIREPLGV